jgi:uncharacterized membrane protein YkoI
MSGPVRRASVVLAAVAVLGLSAAGIAAASGRGPAGAQSSRLDDGKDLLPQATISEAQAIQAAQSAASGDLNEVDLEHLGDRLVYNVDVGAKDVKVDAGTAKVVRVDADD